MHDDKLRLLILGAHPDDADFHAGGLAAIYRAAGHTVKMVSVTDGGAGHHFRSRDELIPLRLAEAKAAGEIIGAEYVTWNFPDGQLLPSLEVRFAIIQEIRRFRPDLVLTHRPCDYHPDHRAVGQAVQDASYLVTVPLVVPEVPALRHDPVVAYLPDRFTRPAPLVGDVAIDVGPQLEIIVEMLACHRSQFFEWLAYNQGYERELPAEDAQRKAFLRRQYANHLRPMADRFRAELVATYGPEHGHRVEFAEVFEVSQYASPLDQEARRRLFWFLP